jgi:hypothetical protein
MDELSGEEKLGSVWVKAGEDLGIKVIVSYALEWKEKSYRYPVFLPMFGGKKGTLIILWKSVDEEELRIAAKGAGFFWSAFNVEAHETYDRKHFIATLDDLGWFGPPDEKPAWYSGQYWGAENDAAKSV